MPSECTMHLPSLFSFFRQFQIVSNTATGNNLPSLFSFFRSSKSFKIPPECMLQRHCFQTFLFSSKSIPIPSECMLQKHCFQNNFFSSKSFQIPSQFMRQRHNVFNNKKSAVPNRFKYCQNACFGGIVFMFSLQLQIVSNTVRLHVLETLAQLVAIHHVLLIW